MLTILYNPIAIQLLFLTSCSACSLTDKVDPKDFIVEKLSRKLAENDKRGMQFILHTI